MLEIDHAASLQYGILYTSSLRKRKGRDEKIAAAASGRLAPVKPLDSQDFGVEG